MWAVTELVALENQVSEIKAKLISLSTKMDMKRSVLLLMDLTLQYTHFKQWDRPDLVSLNCHNCKLWFWKVSAGLLDKTDIWAKKKNDQLRIDQTPHSSSIYGKCGLLFYWGKIPTYDFQCKTHKLFWYQGYNAERNVQKIDINYISWHEICQQWGEHRCQDRFSFSFLLRHLWYLGIL